jgi:hypothetical protein
MLAPILVRNSNGMQCKATVDFLTMEADRNVPGAVIEDSVWGRSLPVTPTASLLLAVLGMSSSSLLEPGDLHIGFSGMTEFGTK